MTTSSIQRIQQHFTNKGAETAIPEELHEDVQSVVRRCEEVRSLGDVYQSIELSPYMQSLLRVSSLDTPSRKRTELASVHSLAAGL